MGLFSLIGGFLGGSSAKKASHRAEDAQLGFLNQALGVQQQQQQQTRADFEPFRQFGLGGVGQVGNLLGFNGNAAQQSGIDSITNSPWYQALYRNGLEANLQNASATGGIRGGNEARSLADFGADTQATAIDRYLQQAMGAIGIGSGATAQGAALGQGSANAIGDIYGNQGQVRAGGILTRGGINNQMWQNAGSFLDNNSNAIFKALGIGF